MRHLRYRFTIYAPPSVDPTETTPLTPRPGSPHAEAFRVTTEFPAPSGWRPYGSLIVRESRIDPLTRHAETGQVRVRVLDHVVTGLLNSERWATAFEGDALGRPQLKGCRIQIEESQDGGATWAPYWTGRIDEVSDPAPSEAGPVRDLLCRDVRVEEYRTVFTGMPHHSVTYAQPCPLWPMGLPDRNVRDLTSNIIGPGLGWAGRRAGRLAPGHVRQDDEGRWCIRRQIIPQGDPPQRYLASAALMESSLLTESVTPDDGPQAGQTVDVAAELGLYVVVLSSSNPNLTPGNVYHYRVGRVTAGRRLGPSGRREDWWLWSDDMFWIDYWGIVPLPEGHPLRGDAPTGDYLPYADVGPRGTNVLFYVYHTGQPTQATPLLIDRVNPLVLHRDLMRGYFGPLDPKTGEPQYPPIPFDEEAYEERISGANRWPLPEVRFLIDRPWDLQEFSEQQLYQTTHWATRINPDGKLFPVSMRTYTEALDGPISALPEITADDAVTTAREAGRDMISAIQVQMKAIGFQEEWLAQARLEAREQGDDQAPVLDVPPYGLLTRDVVHVEQTSGDIAPRPVAIHEIHADGIEPPSALIEDAVREILQPTLAQVGRTYRERFGAGAIYYDQRCVRNAKTDGIFPGDWVILNVPEPPNPASNLRGGRRLVQCVGRRDEGPHVVFRWLDAGPESIAVAPSGSLSLAGRQVLVSVTLNAGGEPAEVWYALTETSVSTPPDEASPLWTLGATVTESGTVALGPFSGPVRVWVRFRTAAAPERLASPFVFPTGAAFVDVTAIDPPSSPTVVEDLGAQVRIAWTPADVSYRTHVYLTVGSGAPAGGWNAGHRVATVPPGVPTYTFLGLVPDTTYTAGLQHEDVHGTLSAVATLVFLADGVLNALPAPLALTSQVPADVSPSDTAGIAVLVTAGDTEAFTELDIAPELGGAPDLSKLETVRTTAPGDYGYLFELPLDGVNRWVRARHVRDGFDAGPDSPWLVQPPVRIFRSALRLGQQPRRPKREVPFDDGKYAVIAEDPSGQVLDPVVTDAGGREVRRFFAKASAEQPDTADAIPDGTAKRVTTIDEATGGGRAFAGLLTDGTVAPGKVVATSIQDGAVIRQKISAGAISDEHYSSSPFDKLATVKVRFPPTGEIGANVAVGQVQRDITVTIRDPDNGKVRFWWRVVTTPSDSYTTPAPTSSGALQTQPYTATVRVDRAAADSFFEFWGEDEDGNRSAIVRVPIPPLENPDSLMDPPTIMTTLGSTCPSQLVDTLTWTLAGGLPAGWRVEVWIIEGTQTGDPFAGTRLSSNASSPFQTTRLQNVRSSVGSQYQRTYGLRLVNSHGIVVDEDTNGRADGYEPCPT
ncbi:MAG TPA: fibronectin type III domain-containing protein [Longimicrobiales bacterium]